MSHDLSPDARMSGIETPDAQRAELAHPSHERDWALLDRLFSGYPGHMSVRLADGSARSFGQGARSGGESAFTLAFRSPDVVRTLLRGSDPLRFAEAYFLGDIDVDGDLFAALTLKDHLHALQLPLSERLSLLLRAFFSGTDDSDPAAIRAASVKAHSRQENREAIAFHYDVSNDFYALWLDQAMVYSCAYFEAPELRLEQAQFAKLDHICRKLQLQPGEHFLDVGCGWGALLMHAARHFGVQAHGVTLSHRQHELATERIRAAGLQDRVTVELRDYRDLAGEAVYDKIASVGMFEHVGLRNLPTYFGVVQRLLKPSGLFLNHGITHEQEGWGDALSSKFINRYVFPDGELDTVSNIQRAMERTQFEIVDVEGLRAHYALTLREWVKRLVQQHQQALAHVNEATFRVWKLYMAASAMEFESGELGIYQILASKRGLAGAGVDARVPLTRRYMYP
jgi:cyclopropane-fatty-acyl-phospholipid synthase